jgi:hypothetical protein
MGWDMMTNKNGVKRSKAQAPAVIGVLLILAFTLQACSSLGGLMGDAPQATPRATWTPESHPTDMPYHVEVEGFDFFGGMPFLAIFGREDPESTDPLQALNLTTEDVYDVSALTPGPISTWSRPITAEDKDIFFQIGNTLYALSPGGGVSSIEIPFDEEEPVFCNWSWQGQLVCLNDLMTQGYLVDQELNVVEMPLPAYWVANDSVEFYPPYRVGESTMRILQNKTNQVGGLFAVHYRDLDLNTLTVSDHRIMMNYEFRRTFGISSSAAGSDPLFYEMSQNYLDVLGITDDGEKIFLQSSLIGLDQAGNVMDEMLWVELYDTQDEEPVQVKTASNLSSQQNRFYQSYLITPWLYYEGESPDPIWPAVYDLRTGDMVFDSNIVYGTSDYYTEILPYGDNWLVGFLYGVTLINSYGFSLDAYYFTEEIIDAFVDPGTYTVTQPMEP